MMQPGSNLRWRAPSAVQKTDVQRLVNMIGVTPITAELLLRRGYRDPDAVTAFFDPTPDDHHNPLKMKGMMVVRDRVLKALNERQHIVIYGDYDADGIPGAALLKIWLSRFTKVTVFIPNREDGYGLSITAARHLLTLNPELIITVDCGSSDHEAVAFLRHHGVDVVVTDHHLTLKGPPPTPYFLNPSRSDGETYPYKHLCGCGVAYKLIQSLLGDRKHETALYDLVLVSTIGDQAPLTGENRYYVKAGLDRLHKNAAGNIGLRSLVNAAGCTLAELNARDVAWKICPRINAVGRMGADPNMVVELLSTSDFQRAEELTREMNRLNASRQKLTDELYEQAINQIGKRADDVIVAYLPEATVGVTGLVAAKLVEAYARPVLVCNSEGRGSGRAPAGMEIMSYMQQLAEMGVFGRERRINGETIVPDFGGHSGACGFRNVDPNVLRAAAKRLRVPKELSDAIEVDAVIQLNQLTTALAQEIDEMSPFGPGNLEPKLVIRGASIVEAKTSRDERHLLLTVSDGVNTRRAVWFGGGAYADRLSGKVELIGRPTISPYSGQPEIILSAIKAAG